MRLLNSHELSQVSGAGGEPTGSLEDLINSLTTPTCTKKNNNGYGNGAESGPPPGNSGAHNPQLLTWNSGKKGPR
jgi:hypothetical protein